MKPHEVYPIKSRVLPFLKKKLFIFGCAGSLLLRGLSLIAVVGLLVAVCGLQIAGSGVVVHGLS